MTYQLVKSPITQEVINVRKTEGNLMLSIPLDPANTDYQAYLKWVSEGNTPLPAEEQA